MLREIVKGKGVTSSEEKLIDLADSAFLGLWAYPNVYNDEGISKKKTGNEMCDLLIVFDNHIIIFSDKSIIFNENKSTEIAWARWFKKSVVESCTQLFGAEKFIKDHPDRIFLDKKCSDKLPVSVDKSFTFHLVAVTNNISSPALKYFDKFEKGSSSTLINTYKYDAFECLQHPFCVGDLYPEKTFVHVLDETSLSLLLTELNTVTDFIAYLTEKERVIRSGLLVLSAGEEETLAVYLMGNKKIVSDDIIKTNQSILIPEGEWESYKITFNYNYDCSLKKGSIFWDGLIQNFSTSILSAKVGFFENYDFKIHELGVRELAKESRKSRYYLSKTHENKFITTQEKLRTSRMMESLDEKGKFYLFLFFPHDEKLSYHEYRLNRIAYVEAYIKVAFIKYRSVKKLIVLATEPQNSKRRSEDLIYTTYTGKYSKEEKEEAKTLSKEYKILSDFLPETVKQISAPLMSAPKAEKIGRNIPCPCGSGFKYKKCHGLYC